MAINLTENVKTYLTYAGIAINSAAVGALILLAGQGINNWRHPKVLASAITGDMLRATHGANVEELERELDRLRGRTDELTQAQRDAQGVVNGAGEGSATAEQTAALEEAQAAVRANADAIAALDAQIANENAVADLIGNDDQRDILVNRLHQIPVPPASESAGN